MPKKLAAAAALAVLILWALLFGPLVPWSPVKPGYQKLASRRGELWYPQGFPELPAYRELDAGVEGVERFLGLRMPEKVTVIDASDWSGFQRFVPQLLGARVGAVTLPTGTVIILSPRIRERGLDVREFIRHELAHAAMHQNQSLWQAIRGPAAVPWFCEGLSVSYGRQKAYLTRAEFLERVRAGADLRAAIDREAAVPGRDMKFDYVAWRSFVEYLRARHGEAAFAKFLRAFLADYGAARANFRESFGHSFEEAITDFGRDLRSGAWEPAED